MPTGRDISDEMSGRKLGGYEVRKTFPFRISETILSTKIQIIRELSVVAYYAKLLTDKEIES